MIQLGPGFFSFFKKSNTNKVKFIRYVLVGGSSALLDFFVFLVLFKLFLWLFPSAISSIIPIVNIAGILSGFTWGFWLQKTWTFQSKGQTHIQFFYTLLLLLFNILITSWAIAPLAMLFNDQIVLAKIIMQIVIMLWNYFIYNYFIFKDAGGCQ